MPVEIRVPPLGESVVEATVGRWTKKEGDTVARDEVLVELEPDKITVEVAAPSAGTLGKVEKAEGDSVGVNELLATMEAGEGAAPADAAPAEAASEEKEAPATATDAAPEPSQPADGDAQTSPAVRTLAAEHGLDLGSITGSGPNGRITKEDVLKVIEDGRARQKAKSEAPPEKQAAAEKPQPAPRRAGEREERQRMSRRRQTIARRLVEAQQTTASLTTFNEVDLSAVIELRKRHQEEFVERHGVKLGFMSIFTKAVVSALKQFPRVNAEIQGEEMVLKHHYDIGIAVGAEEGLVVPVVRDADKLGFADIEKTIGELGKKARDGKLTLDDLQGGTFTITNGGIFGSMLSTPILNPPQVGILGMHNIVERAVVVDGEVVVRPMMYVALTYDHRMVDGREAVQFLVAVKRAVEEPVRMLLEG
jgi:2-oxoglutarate dehydrogenase E2 component (dihydrolipoamide succinyltransferase)